jgi:ferrous iron transport protein B
MLVVIYSLCLVLTWLNAYIAQKVFPTNYSSSVCELAPFVLPSFKKALKFSLNSLTSFIKKIIVSVFLVGIGIGILSSITLKLDYTVDLQESILGFLGKKLAIVFKPIGLGDWRIVVSLLCGLLAKENTLGVLEILYQGNIGFGYKQALCFITYFALYPPCVMALGCVQSQRKGLGIYLVIKHLILGYIGALFVYIILTKGVLFSIIMLGIIFGCVAIYEIYYCKRQRKTFTHCRKGRCRVCSMPKATTQKGYKGQRQKNE